MVSSGSTHHCSVYNHRRRQWLLHCLQGLVIYHHSDGVGSSMFSSSMCPRSSIFQELYVPEALYSMSSMFPKLYVPEPLHVPAVLCSRNSVFPELHTQGAPRSLRSMFRSPSFRSSIFPKPYIQGAPCSRSSIIQKIILMFLKY